MKVFGVTGRNGSGKDEVVDYLRERCGIVGLSAGDILREIAATEQISPTRENLHALAKKVMWEKGRDYVARRLIRLIEVHTGIENFCCPNHIRRGHAAGPQNAPSRSGLP
jgi:dephospho-CoA kinase